MAHYTFAVPMHAVKFLYTNTFQWGLKVATHCCAVVHLCLIQDQPDTEISQIQLQSHGQSASAGHAMLSSFCIQQPFTEASRSQLFASDKCICCDLDLAVTLQIQPYPHSESQEQDLPHPVGLSAEFCTPKNLKAMIHFRSSLCYNGQGQRQEGIYGLTTTTVNLS